MTLAHDLPRPADPSGIDQFVYLHGVSFSEYEALLQMRGDRSVPRITYLRGELELMTPSRYHENDKTRFARLLEAWAEETGTELEGVGSWTLKNSKEERGAEPDECYTVNRVPMSDEDRPDLAIEVIWTAGASTSSRCTASSPCARSGSTSGARCASLRCAPSSTSR